VLDQNIQSMTKFKQIIGRGTRIDDRYNKLWFTILDFKKATELFADKNFDGIPEKILVTKPEVIIDEDNPDFINELNGENKENSEEDQPEVNSPESEYKPADGTEFGSGESAEKWGEDETTRYIKFHVAGVTVKKIAERVQYYDTDGKLVTESFKDYTRNTIKKQFTSLDDFTRKWQDAERKQVIIDELAAEGVIWEALEDDASKELDPFDLICHIAFDQPPLTRQERANNVKKRNYFTKYSDVAQKVLNALLDGYADEGVKAIEGKDALKANIIIPFGRPLEIAKKAFGGAQHYNDAISELEAELYSDKVG